MFFGKYFEKKERPKLPPTDKEFLGRWIEEYMLERKSLYVCPDCDFALILERDFPEVIFYNYCPRCGSCMRNMGVADGQ